MQKEATPSRAFTKSRLIKELSWKCQLPQVKTKAFLEALVEIARREAPTAFALPGICKLEVVRRKPRKVRNPRTGETFILPEREALKITAPRSLKVLFAKAVEPAEQIPDTEDTPAPVDTPAPETVPAETPPAPAPDALISFRCPRCRQEIEVTGDMAGLESECPTCGNPLVIPGVSEPGTIHAASADATPKGEVVSTKEAEKLSPEKLNGLTIRIDVDALGLDGEAENAAPVEEQMVSFTCPTCRQEIEASVDMVGETVPCPNCGGAITVPAQSESNTLHADETVDQSMKAAMKSRTMRIDMSGEF